MTPGTRPARRSERAAPLPARGRAVAFIALTVAMTRILCDAFQGCVCCNMKRPLPRPPGGGLPPRGRSRRLRRLITAAGGIDKEAQTPGGGPDEGARRRPPGVAAPRLRPWRPPRGRGRGARPAPRALLP